MNGSSKFLAPSSREGPSLNLQIPKSLSPCGFGACSLKFLWSLVLGAWCFTAPPAIRAQTNVPPPDPPEWILESGGVFEGKTERPLRYSPDGTDFVITNGAEFFNRPLYYMNTAFRADGGDKPEFSLYLPGRGGNLRFGIKTPAGVKWLHEAKQIITRYRPGSMLYEIRDPLLGNGFVNLAVLPLSETKGIIARAELDGSGMPVELVWAFGGANGMRGRRSGDIGCESEPVSQFFQLRPDQCRSNEFTIETNTFILRSQTATIAGVFPPNAKLAVADARQWAKLDKLIGSFGDAAESPQGSEADTPSLSLSPGFGPLGSGQESEQAGSIGLKAGHDTLETVLKNSSSDRTGLKPGADEKLLGVDSAPRTTFELPVVVGQLGFQPKQPIYLAFAQVGTNSTTFQADNLPKLFFAAEEHRRTVAEKVVVETPDPFINAAAAAINVAGDGIWDVASGAYMHGAVAWRNKLLGWRGPYTGDALGWHDRARRHLTYWAGQQVTAPVPDSIPPADPTSNLSRNEPALHSNGTMSKSHYDMNLVYVDALFRHFLWTGDLEFARQVWPVIERHLAWERRLFRREFGPEKLPLYEAYAAIWASDDMDYHGGGATHTTAYNYWHNKMAARMAKLLGQDAAPYEREAELISKAMQKNLWLPDRGWFAEWKDSLGLQLAHPNAGLWTFYHTIDSEAATPMEAWQMTRFVDTQIARIPIHGSGVPDENLYTLPTTSWMPYTWSLNNVVMAEVAHTSLAYWQANRPDVAMSIFKGCLLDSMFLGLCPGNVGMTTWFDMARGEAQRDFADAVGTSSRAMVEGLFGVQPDALGGELRVRPGFPADWQHARIQHPDFNIAFSRNGLTETFSVELKCSKPMALRLQIPALRDGIVSVTVNGQPAKWQVLEDSVGLPRVEIQAAAAAKSEVVIRWKGEIPERGSPERQVVAVGAEFRPQFGAASFRELADPQNALSKSSVETNSFRAVASGAPGHRTVFAKLRQGELAWWQPVAFEIRAEPEAGAPGPKPTDWKAKLPDSAKWDTINLASAFNDKVTQIFRNDYLSPRSPFCSLAIPEQGIGSWCHFQEKFDVDDSGLRKVAAKNGGKFVLPNGVPFETPGDASARNVVFTSQWDNYPREATAPLSGKASRAYLLMAGSSNPMQSRFDNGEVIVTYADGTSERLALHNPTNWWPIDQDYFIDDFAFRRREPIPPRVDLKTGKVRLLDVETFKGKGGKVPGGAATVLDLPLKADKELKALTVRALANEVVIGLMAVTLVR
jgi:Domain of unknown function (DUF4450)